MDFFNDLAAMDLWYIPLMVLIFFSLISVGVGFINGWKTSLYFFGWNWVGAIAIIFIINAFEDNFISIINDAISGSGANVDVSSAVSLATGVLTLVVLFVSLLVWNLLAFGIYWFFRKHLKHSMKERKAQGHSNLVSRISGGGIAFFTAMPLTMGLAGATTVVSNNEGVNKGVDNLTYFTTMGQVKHISKDFDTFYNIIGFASVAEDFVAIFDPNATPAETYKAMSENEKQVENMLADKNSLNMMMDVVKDSPDLQGQITFDSDPATLDMIKNQLSNGGTETQIVFDVPKANEADIKEFMLSFSSAPTDAKQIAAVDAIYTTIFRSI